MDWDIWLRWSLREGCKPTRVINMRGLMPLASCSARALLTAQRLYDEIVNQPRILFHR